MESTRKGNKPGLADDRASDEIEVIEKRKDDAEEVGAERTNRPAGADVYRPPLSAAAA